MTRQEIKLGICGSGGDGIMAIGEILTSAAAHEGLQAFLLKSFGPQIRGGESSVRLRISDNEIQTPGDRLDILACLSWKEYVRFKQELRGGDDLIVISDTREPLPTDPNPLDTLGIQIQLEAPFTDIAKELTGSPLAKNMVLAGYLAGLVNLPMEGILLGIQKRFSKKSEEIIDKNTKAYEKGVELGKAAQKEHNICPLTYTKRDPKVLIDGNTATAFGALVAGCDFFAGYPITPASEIMEWLSTEMYRFNRIMIQAEDEIAALGMVVGASFAGKKSMTATSGPGFALMVEMIALAAASELPCVIVDVQRAGPSTGIPTKTEQGDLLLALYGSAGDAPRVVIAPADVEDCFQLAIDAFYVAEKYQLPVIILSDQFVGQRTETIDKIKLEGLRQSQRDIPDTDQLTDYKRFAELESFDGVSPMSFLGMAGGEYIAAGLEHNEYGYPSATVEEHQRQNIKRYRKFRHIRMEPWKFRYIGDTDAELGIICWGSTKGAVKEAVEVARKEGIKIRCMIPQLLYPIPFKQIEEFLAPLKKLIIAELTFSGQFFKYLNSSFNLPETHLVKRGGAMPLSTEEILTRIREVDRV
jgi:2-oxoglutarate/2-oxoacid ferredoxin oxidoreductase subunit alpha